MSLIWNKIQKTRITTKPYQNDGTNIIFLETKYWLNLAQGSAGDYNWYKFLYLKTVIIVLQSCCKNVILFSTKYLLNNKFN